MRLATFVTERFATVRFRGEAFFAGLEPVRLALDFFADDRFTEDRLVAAFRVAVGRVLVDLRFDARLATLPPTFSS